MKLTVITSQSGEVVAVQQGHASQARKSAEYAVIVPSEGQTLHEVEVPEVHASHSPQEILRTVAAHLAQ
ncbi:hypothetical protein ACMA1D_14360 [Streptomyces sp. 796.1]|uniref:hypothetical protein n=1 Tax=Streptomyces sp. 796.1 TaxID=3163029 RepID=UPI0039C8DC64